MKQDHNKQCYMTTKDGRRINVDAPVQFDIVNPVVNLSANGLYDGGYLHNLHLRNKESGKCLY